MRSSHSPLRLNKYLCQWWWKSVEPFSCSIANIKTIIKLRLRTNIEFAYKYFFTEAIWRFAAVDWNLKRQCLVTIPVNYDTIFTLYMLMTLKKLLKLWNDFKAIIVISNLHWIPDLQKNTWFCHIIWRNLYFSQLS